MLMIQRDHLFTELWNPAVFVGFKPKLLVEHYGLKPYIKIRCTRALPRCLVLVAYRAPRNEGYDTANFKVDEAALDWLVAQQRMGKVAESYVAIAEGYRQRVLAYCPAIALEELLRDVEPYYSRPDRVPYHWVNEQLLPAFASRPRRVWQGDDEMIDKPLF